MSIPNVKILTKDKGFNALMYKKDRFIFNSFFHKYAIV